MRESFGIAGIPEQNLVLLGPVRIVVELMMSYAILLGISGLKLNNASVLVTGQRSGSIDPMQ